MILEHVTAGPVHPRDDDQLIADPPAHERVGKLRFDLEPRVRRTFRSLPRRLFARLQGRTNKSNRLQSVRAHLLFTLSTTRLTPVQDEPGRIQMRERSLELLEFCRRPMHFDPD